MTNYRPTSKFKRGDKVRVTSDTVFVGTTGIVSFADYSVEDKEWTYWLDLIHTPKMVDKNGKTYTSDKKAFYESWLSPAQ